MKKLRAGECDFRAAEGWLKAGSILQIGTSLALWVSDCEFAASNPQQKNLVTV
jgi:hypothetical protein